MRPRHNPEVASAVARRMAAVSAHLATLRAEQDAAGADEGSLARASASSPDVDTDAVEHSDDPWPRADARTQINDDRWAHWWPEHPASDEPYDVREPRAVLGAGRHLSQRGRSRPSGRSADTSLMEAGRSDAGRSTGRPLRPWISPIHLALVALVLLVGVGLSTWWVARSQPQPVSSSPTTALVGSRDAVATGGAESTVPSAVPSDQATGTASAANASAVVVVHVAGKVRHPGVQALPLGSRVADAVLAAGGPRAGVSLTSLNLARRLVDGEQIIVGLPPGAAQQMPAGGQSPASSGGTAVTPGTAVSLNSADQTTLETLPGVGPVTAAAIIDHREQNGPFTSVDQLLDVQGIGEATLADLAPLVTL